MTTNHDNEPHALRCQNKAKGWLKNGNTPSDITQVKRCHARSKRTSNPCKQPAMANGRCRLHGGLSTGPKTPEGLERSRKANWKHGQYSQEAKQQTRRFSQVLRLITDPDGIMHMTEQERCSHQFYVDELLEADLPL